MEYRFTLSHDAFPDKVISEPQGFDEAQLKLLRHEDFHSLIEYYEGEFIFYGADQFEDGGIDFIREVEQAYGHDTDLRITIEIAPDGYTFETLFVGLLKLADLEELPDNKMQVPVIRDDFWSKFINRQETQVDIKSETNLDNTAADVFDGVNLMLPSQIINKTTEYEGIIENADPNDYRYDYPDGIAIDANGPSDDYEAFSVSGFDAPVQSEIQDSFTYIFAFVAASSSVFNMIEPIDEGGDLSVSNIVDMVMGITGQLSASSDESDPSEVFAITLQTQIYIKVNGGAPVLLGTDTNSVPGPGTPTTLSPVVFDNTFHQQISVSTDITIEPGDLVYVYLRHNAQFVIDVGSDPGSIDWDYRYLYVLDANNTLSFLLKSLFRTTFCPAFLIHDSGGQICDRIIGQDQSFYSEILGSDQTIYRQYDEDGCFWNHAEAKGLQLRRYTLLEKPFFQSFKQWWEGVNPIFNLGLGYENFNGQQIIRVEEKRHFYNETVSLNISNVRDIVRKYDDNRLFKAIRIGYKKWQAEDVSGIDDPQTKKTYASRLQKSGKDIAIESEFIAASLAIETTRRKTREKSADYKFDNEAFIIAIRPNQVNVSPETSPNLSDYEPELDENFSSIENLLNPETRYNLQLTPARNFIRWRDWLSAGLQNYPTDPFKFTSGEGNYDMISQIIPGVCDEYVPALSEKQDLDISTDPFHLALIYEIRVPLTWEEYVVIRDNPKNAIGVSQTEEGHIKFFIQELSYTPDQGEALIQAWPVELLSILTLETTATGQLCVTDCGDTYLTEDGFEYETENGNCLILN